VPKKDKQENKLNWSEKMTIQDFETQVQHIRARNGWTITIECVGAWIVSVYDKETNKKLGETGSFTLEGILIALKTPLNHTVWTGRN